LGEFDLEWNAVVHHVYRETNKCADALTNIGRMFGGDMVF
jgi:hypothetical protein